MPLEGKVDTRADQRIGGIIRCQVGEPVPYRILAIALFEIKQNTMRAWLLGHTRNGLSLEGVVDSADHLRGGDTEVHVKVHPLTMQDRLTSAPTEHQHLAFHQNAIGNDQRIPVPRFECRVPPTNLFDTS